MSSHRAHLARGRGVVSLLCLAQHVAAFSVLASVPGLRSAGNSCRIPVLMCSGKEPQNRRAVISVAAGSAVGLLLSGVTNLSDHALGVIFCHLVPVACPTENLADAAD
jgi:hypothetical protein